MSKRFSDRTLTIAVYLLLLAAVCIPIWSVDYYVVQDGTPHVYNAWLINGLIDGGYPVATEHVRYNSISVPNATGHWILALLLRIFSPYTATKLLLCGIFAAVVASAGWLRLQTSGRSGLKTSLLFGAVLGMNWLWFMGVYNFPIGMAGFIFTVGLYWRWRQNLNVVRAGVISLLILIVYFSHLISFGMLAGSLLVLAVLGSEPERRLKNSLLVSAGIVPSVVLMVIFRSISSTGDTVSPHWRSLMGPISFGSIVRQMLSADPFVIISRKTFPFTSADSPYLMLFAPSLWLAVGILVLVLATIRTRPRSWLFERERLPFIVLFFGGIAAAFLVPDDFGLTHGSILRERILLCSLVFLIPWMYVEGAFAWRRAAHVALAGIVLFQAAAMSEYARHADLVTREFLAAGQTYRAGDAVASVSVADRPVRFHSIPESMMNPINGIGKDIVVWDNYELGHYLFPLTARDADSRKFIHDLAAASAFGVESPGEQESFEGRLNRLQAVMEMNNHRITKLVLWGRDERVDAVLGRWFDMQPVFESGLVRVIEHR